MAESRTPKYSLDELAALGGISPRTVRYYISEKLLPPPLGRGPGKHYDDAHLTRLHRPLAAGRRCCPHRLASCSPRPPILSPKARMPLPTAAWIEVP